MGIKAQVEDQILAGHWIFDILVPPFRVKLAAYLKADKPELFSTTEFCLAHYSGINVEEVFLGSADKKTLVRNQMSAKAFGALTKILVSDHALARVGEFSFEEIEKIAQAELIIQKRAKNISAILQKYAINFVRINNADFRSSSHPHAFGILFLGDGLGLLKPSDLAVSIVHELAHQELFLINLIDRLVNEAFDASQIHAPMQGKPRPPIGRLHSLWALYRMIQYVGPDRPESLKYRLLLDSNIDTFLHNELTYFGRRITDFVRGKLT